jgi:hypothetical protein
MQLSPDDFHFRIDLWDDRDRTIEQVIAFVSDLQVARAAYAAPSPASASRCATLVFMERLGLRTKLPK